METKLALNMEADREELYWEHRVRANWLKNGDKNSSFFHQTATECRQRNRVEVLVDGEGNTYESNADLLVLATNYFNTVFTSNGAGKYVANFYIETLNGLYNMADINSTRIVLISKNGFFGLVGRERHAVCHISFLFCGYRWGCGERLSTLLQMDAIRGALNGYRVNRKAPRITHLFFVDDRLIFVDAIVSGAMAIKDVLESCTSAYSVVCHELLIVALGCMQGFGSGYSLLLVAKEAGKKMLHWCLWKELSVPKEVGRMRFRDLSKFNIALLTKQGWRVMDNSSSLVARVLRAKYFNNSSFMEVSLGANHRLSGRVSSVQRVY
ncbi:hypothetical protein J1N35_025054 [Gossypium stocksii]|uniref:Uncharacterized protein n=1 Tax=Gossypium stocksii TaxID=47602 RepID=A0A9D3V6R3_9ROSI|nr:hypothetical protein J1N35_025054 [Gossypium stocksii]